MDGKKDPPATFAEQLKIYWAPLGTIGGILGVSLAAFLSVAKPFTKKADAAVVERDEKKQASDHDVLLEVKTEVDDMKAGQAWTQSVVLQLAEERGIHPAPVPTPHPTGTP